MNDEVFKPCVTCNILPENLLLTFKKHGGLFSVAKCPNCGLVYSDIKLASDRILDDEAEYVFDFHSEHVASFRQEAFRYISAIQKFKKGGDLLDVGCGMGFFLDVASKFGWQVKGIDISPIAIRAAHNNNSLCNVWAATIDDMNFENGSFDVITMWNCLEHMANPVKSLKKAATWLKPGGLIAVEVPDHDGLIYSLNQCLNFLFGERISISRYLYGSAEGQHVYIPNEVSLKKMFSTISHKAIYQRRTNPPANALLSKYNFNNNYFKATINYATLYALYALAIVLQRQHRLLMVFERVG